MRFGSPQPSPRAGDADRDAALDVLRHAAGEGRLSVDELSDRIELAQAAQTRGELEAIVRDLPAPPVARDPVPEGRRGPRPERAVLGSVRHGGHWTPPARSRYTALLGTVDLDLRHATLPPGAETEIELRSWLGSARVRVPPGVRVEVTGKGLLSSRDVRLGPQEPPLGAPVVRVRTRGVLGSTKVRTQTPLLDQIAAGARRLGAELRRGS